MNQLPGYAPKRTISSGWLLALALLGAVGFIALRYASAGRFTTDGGSGHTSVEPTVRFSAEKAEDILRRQDDALAALKTAIARSQDWTDRALASLDDPALTARRLQMARSASRSAEAQIHRAYSEIEITDGILTERKSNTQ